ncbi:protein shisa-5-like [Festucalex cinctus]
MLLGGTLTHTQYVLKLLVFVFAVMVSPVLSIFVFVSCVIFLPATWAEDCSSYWDDSGVRRDGHECGNMFCCGTCGKKYCCAEKTRQLTQELCDDWPRFEKHSRPVILLGSILGAVIPIIFCVGLITCFVAPCCLLYKKCRKRNSRQRQNVTSTFVAAPHQPASPPQHQPSHPGYQPVPVPPHYGGPTVPTAPAGLPGYMGGAPPVYTPGLPPRPDQHSQPPYNPAYGFNP